MCEYKQGMSATEGPLYVYKNASAQNTSLSLNNAIMEYVLLGTPIDPSHAERAVKLMRFFRIGAARTEPERPTPTTLYHGTDTPFVNTNEDGVSTCAFLSLTSDDNIAKKFGNSVYAFHVPPSFAWLLRFDDEWNQYLLPVGAVFRPTGEERTFTVTPYREAFADAFIAKVECPTAPLRLLATGSWDVQDCINDARGSPLSKVFKALDEQKRPWCFRNVAKHNRPRIGGGNHE